MRSKVKNGLLAALATLLFGVLLYEGLESLNYSLALDTMCLAGETNHGREPGYVYGEIPEVTGVTDAGQAAQLCKEMGY